MEQKVIVHTGSSFYNNENVVSFIKYLIDKDFNVETKYVQGSGLTINASKQTEEL